MSGSETLIQPKTVEKSLTWRVLLAFIFIVFVIQPAIVYNWLVNGLWGLAFGWATMSWTVILLWVGLTRLLGSPLNSKEIFTIRIVESVGLMNTGYYFAYILRNQYFANSEIANMFGLSQFVPSFFSPLGADAERVMLYRTFLDPAWALPVLVSVCVPVLLTAVANYVLGLLAYSLYVREEKLEFPMASWDARMMRSFGKRELSTIRVIALAIAGGAAYGFATNVLAQIFGFQVVPRVWLDLTNQIERYLPGTSFAFLPEIIWYTSGFILPIKYTAAQFIANFALYFVGNYFITTNNLWPAESQWSAGYGILWLYSRSQLYFWNSFAIGWGIAVAIIPLIVRYKTVLRAFAGIRRGISGASAQWLSPKYLILIYLLAASTAIAITIVLVPGFPLWILIVFTLGMSFVITLLQTHTAGVTFGVQIPYLRETMIYYSGYRGLDIWFFPPEMAMFLGGSNISQQLLQASMLEVDVREYTRSYFIIILLGLAGSFLFVSLFWNLNPIPGYAYPYTISAWPVEAMNFWRWQSWLWTGLLFGPVSWRYHLNLGLFSFDIPYLMGAGFGISTTLYLVMDFVFHLPSIPIAMLAGMLQPPYYMQAQFIGAVASYAIAKFVGHEFWNQNKGFIFFGLVIGDGTVSTILMVLTLISRATWLMPY
jgi:hypothetical protein